VEGTGDVGAYTSIAIGTDGLGVASYYDTTNGHLKVAHCNNTACTSADITHVDGGGASTPDVGRYTSLTIGADGFPIISYQADADDGSKRLKVAHCLNVDCTSGTTHEIDIFGEVGKSTSIVIGIDGRALISYFDVTSNDLNTAHCSNITCSESTTSSTVTTGGVGDWNSMTIGTDGHAIISYYDSFNGYLEVAHCDDVTCASATSVDVDTSTNVGQHTSITIGSDGLPLVIYHDVESRNLKAVHCSNSYCLPNVRNR
jgi:hypothetical protein